MSELTFLHFPDESTAKKATGWWSKSKGWVMPTTSLQIAVRGVLYNDDGEYAEDGTVIKEPTVKQGFFIDVLYGEIPEKARGYIVTPVDPEFILA
ncbi:hypothetical protein ABHD31_08105 [Enterobacter cloacae]|uniref:hypothetical protein n=1 Tax=Enterobacter cloacae TaxID=550 RepID=UPI00325BFB24